MGINYFPYLCRYDIDKGEERCLGAKDTSGKQYMSNPVFFADAFNYLLYEGREIIKADGLQELDTTELTAPYGNNARVPVQRYRDLLKIWNAMMDKNAIYVILGAEIQSKVHYGMPVKDGLYDMLGYSKQIAEIKRSYTKSGSDKVANQEEGELAVEEGVLKIKLTSEEFLSGLRKGDKLIPIITAVMYFGEEPWDGPRSLYDMLDIKDEALKKFIPNYWINLISPADMDEDEFKKFHTELGEAMRIIKHQKEDADEIIIATNHRKFSPQTAYFLNSVAKLDLEFVEEAGGVDMCQALENRDKKMKIIGVIDYMRDEGKSENDIVEKIIEKFNVTKEYVCALLEPQKM